MEKTIKVSDLQDFDVLFCKRDTILSDAIAAMTRSEISHVEYVRWQGKKLKVIGAQIDGFKMRELDEWKARFGYDVFVVRMKGLDNESMFKREIELMGKKYDLKATFVKQPRKQVIDFLNRFRKNKKDNWNEEANELEKVNCSEAFEYIFFGTNENSSPQDVLNKCCFTPNFEFLGKLEY
jgi:hypothetical protein